MIQHLCDDWDARFFALCTFLGAWSEDRSRQVGSVVVGPGNEIRATGYNGLPRKVLAHFEARYSHEDAEKYLWFEHAERNAIYNMARAGVSALGCRMYVDAFPCADCARAIIQSGIVELNSFPPDMTDKTFARHYTAAEAMFSESGISLRLFQRDDARLRQILEHFLNATGLKPERILGKQP
jgi:dCMP deaminase